MLSAALTPPWQGVCVRPFFEYLDTVGIFSTFLAGAVGKHGQ